MKRASGRVCSRGRGRYSREVVVPGGQQQQRRAGVLHRRVQRRQHLVRVCLHCAQPQALAAALPTRSATQYSRASSACHVTCETEAPSDRSHCVTLRVVRTVPTLQSRAGPERTGERSARHARAARPAAHALRLPLARLDAVLLHAQRPVHLHTSTRQ